MKSKTAKLKTVAALALFFFVGCSLEARVESDTRWSGSFGGRTVDGTGNATISLSDDETCCVVQKMTASGRLKVTIQNSNPLASGKEKETTAQYGVVSVCWN